MSLINKHTVIKTQGKENRVTRFAAKSNITKGANLIYKAHRAGI